MGEKEGEFGDVTRRTLEPEYLNPEHPESGSFIYVQVPDGYSLEDGTLEVYLVEPNDDPEITGTHIWTEIAWTSPDSELDVFRRLMEAAAAHFKIQICYQGDACQLLGISVE